MGKLKTGKLFVELCVYELQDELRTLDVNMKAKEQKYTVLQILMLQSSKRHILLKKHKKLCVLSSKL
jgi:hypothetical protein